MIKCQNCGAQMQDDFKFCQECGRLLEQRNVCPSCNAELPANAKFCAKCGKAVITEPAAQTQPAVNNFYENERTLMDVAANLFRGVEAVGGKLIITTKRLIFNSHSFNIQVGSTEIPLNDIDHLEKDKSLGFINNQLIVALKGGVKHRFVVNGRDNVYNVIENEIRR